MKRVLLGDGGVLPLPMGLVAEADVAFEPLVVFLDDEATWEGVDKFIG